tara:strand:- start:7375 stop:8553 length:1179 start_codon:yes stop_codon:yes gene_type:complete
MRKSFADLLSQSLKGKVVLVRVDFNAPLKDGRVADDTRIKASLGTIQALTQKGARVVLISHLSRPGGRVDESKRLSPIRDNLQALLGHVVQKVDDCIGPNVESAIQNLNDSDVLLLENIRFYKEEEANDADFSKRLASYGDYFVQDAFGAVHRQHASTYGIAQYLPAFSGLLLDKELDYLTQVLNSPTRPLTAIIGGAKISSKFSVLENLLQTVDVMVLGGAMVYTLLAAQGISVGQSLVEPDLIPKAHSFLERVNTLGKTLYLPEDHVAVTSFDDPRTTKVVEVFNDDQIGVDAGPASVARIQGLIESSKTVFWNGPLGVFETPEYSNGTFSVARSLADAHHATTIVGGGDSIAAVNQAGVADQMDHISTGGGASLEFLEGKVLPGISVLS